MQLLKQSTTASLTIGPVLDSAGAEYTGAVIGDISISKNGTTSALGSPATLTHIGNGFYTLALATGNTDTLGRLSLYCNKSTYQMPPRHLTVVTAEVFDTLITNGTLASTTSGRTITTDAAGYVDANTVRLGGVVQTGRNIGASVLLSSGTGAGEIDLSSGQVKVQSGTGAGQILSSSGQVTVGTNNDKSGYALSAGAESSLAAAVWAYVVEGGRSAVKLMRLFSSVLFGKTNSFVNGTSGTGNIRDVGDTKDRVVVSYDANGNRSSVTLDDT
jgi:hypothetical protein